MDNLDSTYARYVGSIAPYINAVSSWSDAGLMNPAERRAAYERLRGIARAAHTMSEQELVDARAATKMGYCALDGLLWPHGTVTLSHRPTLQRDISFRYSVNKLTGATWHCFRTRIDIARRGGARYRLVHASGCYPHGVPLRGRVHLRGDRVMLEPDMCCADPEMAMTPLAPEDVTDTLLLVNQSAYDNARAAWTAWEKWAKPLVPFVLGSESMPETLQKIPDSTRRCMENHDLGWVRALWWRETFMRKDTGLLAELVATTREAGRLTPMAHTVWCEIEAALWGRDGDVWARATCQGEQVVVPIADVYRVCRPKARGEEMMVQIF